MEQIFLISCDCVYCTWIVSVRLAGCPCHHCSLSQLDLFDISQAKWRRLTVRYKHWIWEVEGWILKGDGSAGRAYFEELLVVFCSVLALFFSQNTVFCCPQDVAENVFDLPEEPSHSPVFPKMLCHSSDKYNLDSSIHLPIWIKAPTPAIAGPADSSSLLLMDRCMDQLNCLHEMDEVISW